MIPEIGLVVCLYVLTRLASAVRPSVAKPASIIAIIAIGALGIDLAVRSVTSEGILALLRSKSVTESPSQPGAQPSGPVGSVTRASGGPITTNLGFGIAIAKNSTLNREWIVVHHPTLPVDLEATPGIVTAFISKPYGGEYRYRSQFKLRTEKAVKAVEVRFLVFDVWGQHVRNLSYEEVSDRAVGIKDVSAEWQVFSENEVEKHYASIGYVARVRLDDGRVVEAPVTTVVEEARKFSSKFTPEQLEPKPAAQPAPAKSGA